MSVDIRTLGFFTNIFTTHYVIQTVALELTLVEYMIFGLFLLRKGMIICFSKDRYVH